MRIIGKLLQPGDKLKQDDTGEVVTLTYVGEAMVAGVLRIQWRGGAAYISPDQEFELVQNPYRLST